MPANNGSAHSQNPNVFDDEFAVETPTDMIPVADGLRHGSSAGQGGQAQGQDDDTSTRTSTSTTQVTPTNSAQDSNASGLQPRNSIAKRDAGRNSFTMANDGARNSVLGTGQSTSQEQTSYQPPQNPQRPISTVSSYAPTDRAQSPLPAGPSHPYGMYPQATAIPRSLSVATSHVSHNSSAAYTSNRPTHPYAMYQQNVVDDDEAEAVRPTAQPIPVGFPGHTTDYHRQIGPDGEEQDIVGPDGHTEQLPPYSRYPEGAAKIVAEDATPEPLPNNVPAANSNPSRQDIPSTISQSSSQATPTSSAGLLPTHSSPPNTSNVEERPWNEKSWKEKRNSKVMFGLVPCWAMVLGIILIMVIGAVLGGVIGGAVTKDAIDRSIVTVTASLYDATPIATPSSLPTMPIGNFALPAVVSGGQQEQQPGCLANASQKKAWDCRIIGPPLRLDVTPSGTNSNNSPMVVVSLQSIDPSMNFSYGMQPPVITPQRLMLVSDLDEPTRGPAYHFQATYDKVVLVSDDNFEAGNVFNQRDVDLSSSVKFGHRFQVEIGAKPWMCFWNSTFLEGFIYMQQPNSGTPFSSDAPTTTIPSGSVPTSASSSYDGDGDDDDEEEDTQVAASTSNPNGGLNFPTTATSNPFGYGTPAAQIMSPGSFQRRDAPSPTSKLPLFPYVVKLEERRVPSPTAKPYCQQMQYMNDFQLQPFPGPANVNRIEIEELDPSPADFASAMPSGSSDGGHGRVKKVRVRREGRDMQMERRDDPADSCHCQWMNT
ncbi:hypothetical protein K402DRAFT_407744 [Aulographum hederae CBS 113979]|uniref:DUF7820 domain-containing protein n=1 Tax=Aulographum hederae CBS 113979 TaxID=1176131 RepID=A0A6G1GMP5_9PEZI|nr:hypothetical protein K402DRAFT_407744 [Aulographum hederae CBS 113979]